MSDCGRCRDCKHYFAFDPLRKDELDGLCGIGYLEAMYRPTEGASIHVMANFGCVQFEKREDSNGD